MPTPLLTAAEVAQVLRLNIETVYALIAKQRLPAVKLGGQWRFEETKVHQWFKAQYAVHEEDTVDR